LHSCREESIPRVESIEHGHLADEATVEMPAERDVWLSMQPFAEHDHTPD
jgi:hypothetical protein